MWLVPISSLTMIIGLIYEEVVLGKNELGMMPGAEITDEEESITETTKLMKDKRASKRRRSSVVEIKQRLSRQYNVDRRVSCEVREFDFVFGQSFLFHINLSITNATFT